MSRIVLGITGGIAAYKGASLIRIFTEAGHSVKVIPTQNALRFIGAATLEALSHNAVDPELYTDIESVKHIALAAEADLVVVAPATASFIARTASGVADDLLSNTVLATKAPILIAPAMHSEMWLNPATQANVSLLKNRGIAVLTPAVGRLTGDDSGIGRLPEPEHIADSALSLLTLKDFAGKRILVSAGGTHEPIDPVRFIGNRSSGKQGIAIARRAAARGAQVTLIGANIEPISGSNLDFVAVETTEQLSSALENIQDYDALIMAAAVADFRVAEPANSKLKRSELGSRHSIELVANDDLLARAVAQKEHLNLDCLIVGFAAETAKDDSDLRKLAAHKLMSKGCDLLVANDVSNGKVFASENNEVIILAKSAKESRFSGSKTEVADHILDILSNL